MRLLFVVPYVPSRVRVRPYNLLLALAEAGHDLTLATLQSSADETEALEALRRRGIRALVRPLSRTRAALNCVRALPTTTPLQAAWCRTGSLERAVLEAIRANPGLDAIHVEHLRGVHYALAALDAAPRWALPPVIWDAVDSISLLFERAQAQGPDLKTRLMTWLDLARTRAYEAWLTRRLRDIVVTSTEDAAAFTRLAGGTGGAAGGATARLSVVPNGVDLDYFQPQAIRRDPATLVFTGKMSYHANVAAAVYLVQAIMPRVWAGRPDTQLLIVGQNPTPQVRALARQAGGRVVVTGSVPDMRPYLARATVAVCPLRYGVGIQNKALEAMAMGAPVVATPQAVAALAARPGVDLLVGGDEGELARRVLGLLDDGLAATRVGEAGRRYVERQHQWAQAAARLERIYGHGAEDDEASHVTPPPDTCVRSALRAG